MSGGCASGKHMLLVKRMRFSRGIATLYHSHLLLLQALQVYDAGHTGPCPTAQRITRCW